MHDPETLVFGSGFFEIWHRDPCHDGTDDSCGWFKRARHGDKDVLKKIVKAFEYDWDRTYTSESTGVVYPRGFFTPNEGCLVGSPFSVGLNLFVIAAIETFETRKEAFRFLQSNLCEILLFCDNPFDSLRDGLLQTFGDDGFGEAEPRRKKQIREDRIRNTASTIYGWILRQTQPWYRHPRWHFWHWRIRVPILNKIRRFFTSRCETCGERFGWNESPVCTGWHGEKFHHSKCIETIAAK